MKTCCISLNGAIAKTDYSHRASWVKMRMHQEGEEWDLQPKPETLKDYDRVIIYMGMEWKGVLNLFGGNESPLLEYARKLKDIDPNKVAWLDLHPDNVDQGILELEVYEQLERRIPEEDWSHIKKFNQIMVQPRFKNLVVGDSHAISQYRPGWNVNRNDFKTLHGALKDGLSSFLLSARPERLCLYFGNIDIRHHLNRQVNTVGSTIELATRYVEQVEALLNTHDQLEEVEIVWPLFLESEDRKLPKSGFYKGEPFSGTVQERSEIRKLFCDTLVALTVDNPKIKMYQWPITWLETFTPGDNSTMLLDQEYMERPRSVHLAWKYSRFMRGEE